MNSLVPALLFALIPIVGGIVLIVKGRRGGRSRPACGGCGFDISTMDGSATACPECGASFSEAGIVAGRGTAQTDVIAGGVVLLMLGAGCLGGAMVAQRTSVRAAREAETAANDAEERAREHIQALITQGQAEALESAASQPAVDEAEETDDGS